MITSPRGVNTFNPRPPARGATFPIAVTKLRFGPSIHAPPRGGRPEIKKICKQKIDFNPRPPARGATRVESRTLVRRRPSIHAPPRGGRPPPRVAAQGGESSIHAPPRGGRRVRVVAPACSVYLQSTPPREGGDWIVLCLQISGAPSIHAPPRGGRPEIKKICKQKIDFNPRPPARGATYFFSQTFDIDKLQSTPPREGGDDFPEKSCIFIDASIHAPPRGGRPYERTGVDGVVAASIHAPPRGGRRFCMESSIEILKLQSTPPREGGDSKDAQFLPADL